MQCIFRRFRENPDDEYAQYGVENLFLSNDRYRNKHGINIPGFEDSFYEEVANLNPNNDVQGSGR